MNSKQTIIPANHRKTYIKRGRLLCVGGIRKEPGWEPELFSRPVLRGGPARGPT